MMEATVAPRNPTPDNNAIPRNRPVGRLTVRDSVPGSGQAVTGAFASDALVPLLALRPSAQGQRKF